MNKLLVALDQLIADCAKRDLVPSAEMIDGLLDLRTLIGQAQKEEVLADA